MSARPDRPARAQDHRPTAADGLLVVDKPAGMTSHDVVARVRRLAATRKVGHAGTLDPMATGVLVLGIGRGTRLLTYLVGSDKDYDATIRLGQSTTTDDAEGELVAAAGAAELDEERLRRAVSALTGPISQVPSAVSAIKVDGKRAYARVRAGEEVELAARDVVVSRFDVLDVRKSSASDGTPVVDLAVSVTCSSGTYVRALARDLGAALGAGGHLTALRRARVGAYGIEAATPLDVLEAAPTDRPIAVLPLADAARAMFAPRELSEAETRALSYGQRLDAVAAAGGPVAAFSPSGELVALLENRGDRAVPLLVFAPA
ncbi:tRNA pseudouridine(55) synthase TruB [Cellulomonas sp. NTE-D12]|uniref:tRNA pseudouridine(55) synthase TruB n=1 Tax=Cellulomonas sp. NTE-D12 TaxID=2962632 RepID=UPI003081DD8C|nr:tRNA pseudouridine synthase B [Cellulomonas sp. NTE-D12]